LIKEVRNNHIKEHRYNNDFIKFNKEAFNNFKTHEENRGLIKIDGILVVFPDKKG
jgi:hypothetical protein